MTVSIKPAVSRTEPRRITVTVTCDSAGCNSLSTIITDDYTAATERLHDKGWTKTKDGWWYCRACS